MIFHSMLFIFLLHDSHFVYTSMFTYVNLPTPFQIAPSLGSFLAGEGCRDKQNVTDPALIYLSC